jgi:hypothetical protein
MVTNAQLALDIPKDMRERRVTIKLNNHDVAVLRESMAKYGETNMSSFFRRLLHDNYRLGK